MPVFVLVVFLAAWLIILWFGSIALESTGMERRKARFQALSALTGTGFTTGEAESVVNHPTRRTIATCLILLGNTGIIGFLVTVILYVRSGSKAPSPLFILIVVALLVLLILSIRLGVTGRLSNAMLSLTRKRISRPFLATGEVLHQVGSYGVVRLAVGNKTPRAGFAIKDTEFPERGFSILAIERKDTVLPFPAAEELLLPGDQILCYGEMANIDSVKL